jgi:hypothetical protein
MQSPAYLSMKADRFTEFAATLTFRGLDLRSRSYHMQVRAAPNAPGAALVDLPSVTASGINGVRFMSFSNDTDGTPISKIGVFITEASIRNLSTDTNNEDVVLAYDFQIVNGTSKEVTLYGPFILRAGVVQ